MGERTYFVEKRISSNRNEQRCTLLFFYLALWKSLVWKRCSFEDVLLSFVFDFVHCQMFYTLTFASRTVRYHGPLETPTTFTSAPSIHRLDRYCTMRLRIYLHESSHSGLPRKCIVVYTQHIHILNSIQLVTTCSRILELSASRFALKITTRPLTVFAKEFSPEKVEKETTRDFSTSNDCSINIAYCKKLRSKSIPSIDKRGFPCPFT